MNVKKKIPDAYQTWIEVRKRYHLSHAQIQMARELGMNPRRFGKIVNEKQEPWKAPLPAFIHLRRRPWVLPVDDAWIALESFMGQITASVDFATGG